MSTLGGCGGLERTVSYSSYIGGCGDAERTDFLQFLLWEVVLVLKELILTVSKLDGCGGLEGTDFFYNGFYFGRVWWP